MSAFDFHCSVLIAWKSDCAEERVLSLTGIESGMLNDNRNVGLNHAGVGRVTRDFLWRLKIIEPQMPGALSANLEPIRSNRIFAFEKNHDLDSRDLVGSIQNATSLVTGHFRRGTVAFGWNISFSDCPNSFPNALHPS